MKGVETVPVSTSEQASEIPFEPTETVVNDIAKEKADENVENATRSEAEPKALEFQEKIEILAAHFGTQYFKYGKHEGTFDEMINLCGAVRMMIDQESPEAIVDWLSEYVVDTPEPAKDEGEPDNDTSEVVEDELDDDKKPVEISKVLPVEPVKKSLPVPDKKPTESPVADTNIVVPVAVVAAISLQKEQENVIEVPAVAEVQPVEVPKVVVPIIERSDVVETPKDIIEEPEQVNQQQEHKEHIETPAEMPAELPTEEEAVEAPIVAIRDEPHEAIELSDFIDNEADEVFYEAENDEPISEIIEDEKIELSVAEVFDSWQELAEEDVPLEEFLVAMVEGLSSEVQVVPQAAQEVIIETDEGLEKVSPELQSMLAEIVTIKAAVERLQYAKTKEECSTEVEEIITRMTELLRLLGYENPEKIIRDFLYTHPLSSLFELIEALEISLRQRIQQEAVRSQQKGNVHKRHLSFGRFVLYVMQSISHRNATADLSI